MENLIAIEGKEKIKANTIEELVKKLISADFYELSKEEKINKLEIKTTQNCIFRNIPITKSINNIDLTKDKFILHDQYTYILSLVKNNIIILLERVDSNIFTKTIDKTNIKDNYIIVNKYIDEILIDYINKNKKNN